MPALGPKKRVSIIIPAYNEETCLNELRDRLVSLRARLVGYEFEFIFVNDGSTDRTLEILKGFAKDDQSVKVISFSRNFGHEAAISAGCQYATGDAVVFIDADLQDPPELIPEMLKRFEEGFDVVYAVRRSRAGETLFKKKTAQWFYSILGKLSYIPIPSETSNFRLISRKALQAFNSLPERDRFIRGMVTWIGFRQTGVEFDRGPRYAGQSKYTLKKMINFALDGIVGFSNLPLRLAFWIGSMLLVLAGIVFLFGLLGMPVLSLSTTLVISAILLVGGLHLIVLGIISEYIARIYNESKARPLYIIDEKINIP